MVTTFMATAQKSNPDFVSAPRNRGEDNIVWLRRVAPGTPNTVLAMFGGVDSLSIQLRVAQAVVRQDLSPSHWSNIVIVRNPKTKKGMGAGTRIFDVNLNPDDGFGFPPSTNGIQSSTLKDYADPQQFPNVALLDVPVNGTKVNKAVERFYGLRHTVNGPEMLLAWLGFVWGVSSAANPLLSEVGVPSAVLVEFAIGALGFDISPGLGSRSSCPEAIWQSAKWWYDFYKTDGADGADAGPPPKVAFLKQPKTGLPITGSWCVDHKIGS